MIFRVPDYYNKFHCIADRCMDNCCIGWEIDIDSDTADYYKTVSGYFGEKLESNISDNSFILDKDERCPFLNSHNLCDIYTTLGENRLCQICSDHPRYFEWFDGLKEGGIGMCCEAAANLILSEDFSISETIIPDEDCSNYDTELFDLLDTARNRIFHAINNLPFYTALCQILDFAEELQNNIDNGEYVLPEMTFSEVCGEADILCILDFFTQLEPIDKYWIPYLKKCIQIKSSVQYVSESETLLRRIASYFIFRYFMKGVFDGEILSKVKLMAVSCEVIAFLWICSDSKNVSRNFENHIETARKYSKEIEYCEENIDMLSEAFYSKNFFSSDYLKTIAKTLFSQ